MEVLFFSSNSFLLKACLLYWYSQGQNVVLLRQIYRQPVRCVLFFRTIAPTRQT